MDVRSVGHPPWGGFGDFYMFHKVSGYSLSSLNFALVLGETWGTNLKLGNGRRFSEPL